MADTIRLATTTMVRQMLLQTVVAMAVVVRMCKKAQKVNKTSLNVLQDPVQICWAYKLFPRSSYVEIRNGPRSTEPLVVTLRILIIA